jgi:glutamine amidotransferase
MTVAVVDSGGANIASVLHALRRLGAEPIFTGDPKVIRQADHVILPGVGAAGNAMDKLRDCALIETMRDLRQPVLGVCLGMQLLFESTEEGDVEMLGLIPGRVTRLTGGSGLRVPHMGWNTVTPTKNDNSLSGALDTWFYFVHSFAAPIGDWTTATVNHGQTFSAAVRNRNFRGVQFHPERSSRAGAELLARFLREDP